MDATYHCSAGETWDSVALKIYGDEKYACDLMMENPTLCLITMFTGGEEIRTPDLDIPDGEAEYVPATAPWKE